jgi:hypothetical protein
MALIVYSSDHPLCSDKARAAPAQEIIEPWLSPAQQGLQDVIPRPKPIRWSMTQDGNSLWFFCSIPSAPSYDEGYKPGEFVEGLWLQDVAEFFLRDAESGEYQEFNVAPSGAWWTCVFTEYRKRAMNFPKPRSVCVERKVTADRWEVVFGVKLSELSIMITSQTHLHVAVISADPVGSATAQRFFSSHPLAGAEPDFHTPKVFLPIEFRPLAPPAQREDQSCRKGDEGLHSGE